jgi:hypothetical protein
MITPVEDREIDRERIQRPSAAIGRDWGNLADEFAHGSSLVAWRRRPRTGF